MLNKSIHISGSLIDDVYIKKAWMEEFFNNVIVENIYFLDHFLNNFNIFSSVVNMAIERDRQWR